MRLLKQAALLAVIAYLAILAPSFAQEIAAGALVVAEPTLLQQILVIALPALFGVIALVSLLIYAEVKRRFGIDIEAKHREALQSALENGIRWALVQAGWLPAQPVPGNLVKTATTYVASSVPDALKKFNIDPSTPTGRAQLERLLTPHLPIGGQLIGQIISKAGK